MDKALIHKLFIVYINLGTKIVINPWEAPIFCVNSNIKRDVCQVRQPRRGWALTL